MAISKQLGDREWGKFVESTTTSGQPSVAIVNPDGTNVAGTFGASAAGADAVANPTMSKIFAYLQGFNGTTWDRIRTAVTTVSSTLTGFLNTLPWSIYHATPTTRTDGQGGPLESDTSGNLKVTDATAKAGENLPLDVHGVAQKAVVSSSYSGQAFSNFGAATNASVTTVPTMLKSIHAQNENAAIRYLQVFNLAAAPTDDSSVPIFSFAIPAGSATNPGICDKGSEFFGEAGYYLSAGLSWGISVDPDVFDNTGVTPGEHQVNGIRV